MPARMISLKYAETNKIKVISEEEKVPTLKGSSALMSQKPKKKTKKKNQKITSTSGIERIRLTYPVTISEIGLMLDSRIMANIVPMTIPPSIANSVNCTVKAIPVWNKYIHERWMTSKSKVPNTFSALRHWPQKNG